MRAAAEACQGGSPVISSSSLNRHNMKASSLWLVGFCHCGNLLGNQFIAIILILISCKLVIKMTLRQLSHSKYHDRPVSDKLRRRAEYMDSERAELIERISQTESLHRRRPPREGPARSGEGLARSGEDLRRSREDFVRLNPEEGWHPGSSSGSGRERSCVGTSQQALGSLRSVSIHPQVMH